MARYRVLLIVVAAVLAAIATMSCGDTGDDGGNKQEKPAANEKPTPEEPEMTSGQENALQVAQDYIDLQGFSKAGLIDQLSSPAGEGFSEADATFAANNVDADWNAEAVEAAEAYLDLGGMSKSALIDQLSSSAGDKFTPAQAQYAADKVY
jgi:Host cell surface-exposed lipoprotein